MDGAERMKVLHLVWICLVLLTTLRGSGDALAQPSEESGKGRPQFGIIEQTISVPFRAVTVYALVETAMGEIRQYRAIAVPASVGATEIEAGQPVLVGAVVPVSSSVSPDAVFHFSFFATGVNGDFAATEIQSLTWKALLSSGYEIDTLKEETAKLEQSLPTQREENLKLESQLSQLRDQAAKIAGVDDLIDLKSELDSLKGSDEKKAVEVDRIKLLSRNGFESAPPKNADESLMDLGAQLRLAAKVTAEADKVGLNKKGSAEAEYRRKLELVRRAEGADPQALAQQVFNLRKRRKELEARLNAGTETESETDQDF